MDAVERLMRMSFKTLRGQKQSLNLVPTAEELTGCTLIGQIEANPVTCCEQMQQVLAVYQEGAVKGKAAIGVSDFGKGKRIFIGCLELSDSLIREISRICGIHIYCEQGQCLHVGNRCITLYTDENADSVEVRLPREYQLQDLYTGEIMATNLIKKEFHPFFAYSYKILSEAIRKKN